MVSIWRVWTQNASVKSLMITGLSYPPMFSVSVGKGLGAEHEMKITKHKSKPWTVYLTKLCLPTATTHPPTTQTFRPITTFCFFHATLLPHNFKVLVLVPSQSYQQAFYWSIQACCSLLLGHGLKLKILAQFFLRFWGDLLSPPLYMFSKFWGYFYKLNFCSKPT